MFNCPWMKLTLIFSQLEGRWATIELSWASWEVATICAHSAWCLSQGVEKGVEIWTVFEMRLNFWGTMVYWISLSLVRMLIPIMTLQSWVRVTLLGRTQMDSMSFISWDSLRAPNSQICCMSWQTKLLKLDSGSQVPTQRISLWTYSSWLLRLPTYAIVSICLPNLGPLACSKEWGGTILERAILNLWIESEAKYRVSVSVLIWLLDFVMKPSKNFRTLYL